MLANIETQNSASLFSLLVLAILISFDSLLQLLFLFQSYQISRP
jgi:hypothetical protein